jgi:pantetheine-phosphate adenylyltransferase
MRLRNLMRPTPSPTTPPPRDESTSISRALYPGSFDPITGGHIDIVRRGLNIFDRVTIAVARNIHKTPIFTFEERVAMIEESLAGESRVDVVPLEEGLLVDFAQAHGIKSVLRGLRAMSDFEYEFQMASMNRRLTEAVDYVFLMTSEEHYFVSSSLVRDVAMNGGDVRGLVPKCVADRLEERFLKRSKDSALIEP